MYNQYGGFLWKMIEDADVIPVLDSAPGGYGLLL
jgi:hypothetical protein